MTVRSTLPAIVAAVLLSAAPASAQPSPSPECAGAQQSALNAKIEADRVAENLATLELARSMFHVGEKAKGLTQQKLMEQLRLNGALIEQFTVMRERAESPESVRRAVRYLAVLQRYEKVLLDFQATRARNVAIDPVDNELARWKRRIDSGIPTLKAKLKGAQAAARGAQLTYDQCRSGRAAAEPPAAQPPASWERPYKTTVGNGRFAFGPSSVAGTYRVHRGPRLANGPADQPTELTPGKVRGWRGGSLATGYWFEESSRIGCPQPMDGYRDWGQFRWELKADGSWTGFRGNCYEKPTTERWDGSPGG